MKFYFRGAVILNNPWPVRTAGFTFSKKILEIHQFSIFMTISTVISTKYLKFKIVYALTPVLEHLETVSGCVSSLNGKTKGTPPNKLPVRTRKLPRSGPS